MKSPEKQDKRRSKGFVRAAGLIERQVRGAGEKRGFAESRLLTNWSEIVGADLAAVTRPVKVGYSRGRFGATLVLLTTGAQAPLIQARIPEIRDRVNACYGYSAIQHVRITQTAPDGFAEGAVEFVPNRAGAREAEPQPETRRAARQAVAGIADEDLAQALERLARNVLSRTKT